MNKHPAVTVEARHQGSIPQKTTTRFWKLLQKIARSHSTRRDLICMTEKDDYLLHDIGVTRGDVCNALVAKDGIEASRKLAARAQERRNTGDLA